MHRVLRDLIATFLFLFTFHLSPRVPPQPIEISTAYTRSPNPNQGSDRLQESYIFPRRQTHIQKPTVDPESSGPRSVVICVVSAAAAVVSVCLRMYTRLVILGFAGWEDCFTVVACVSIPLLKVDHSCAKRCKHELHNDTTKLHGSLGEESLH